MAKHVQSTGAVVCCVGAVAIVGGAAWGVWMLPLGLLVFILGRMIGDW